MLFFLDTITPFCFHISTTFSVREASFPPYNSSLKNIYKNITIIQVNVMLCGYSQNSFRYPPHVVHIFADIV